MEFPGQRSILSHSCDLHHSCGNTVSFSHQAWPGMETASQHCRDTANPTVLQWELLELFTKQLGAHNVLGTYMMSLSDYS